MQCNETIGCAEVGIGIAAALVYTCGLIELVRVRRITHCEWVMTGKGELVGLKDGRFNDRDYAR
jgi:hypothetical protein